MAGVASAEQGESAGQINFAWLEVTGRCQLGCSHCYAGSGPDGDYGSMGLQDWERTIDQLAEMGVGGVQFIGGEPTLYPDLGKLLNHATAAGLKTEVYSNLVAVRPELWDDMKRNGTTIATSYYSPDREEHQAITGYDTLRQTERNIAKAVELEIPIRAEIVDVLPDQQIGRAIKRLGELGVGRRPRVDAVRGVGRGAVLLSTKTEGLDISQLCGGCTSTLMIGPSGDVTRCVFTREVPAGNVLRNSLMQIVTGLDYQRLTSALEAEFDSRIDAFCAPDACPPKCPPFTDCMPWKACSPKGSKDDGDDDDKKGGRKGGKKSLELVLGLH